ncbi:probable homogentisate phytyltransferase 1, chloroplastic isoform X3 [Magnolia sinica]|uniref:probable homogentisate phytyltransferase 1, chloroplastic isoform X3 n=1 Tax=Magnolia sinica TaxID=86752 RepID=UPI0026595CAD|nr:probable homogentisate phytyltransferase 1, chloroplastic isoform X3 [Magnolia sinica]
MLDSVMSGVSSRPLINGHFGPILSTLPKVQVSNCRSCGIVGRYRIGVSHRSLSNHHIKSTDGKAAIYRMSRRQSHVNATSGHPLESEPEAFSSKGSWKTSLDIFYRFSRPHTVIGTVNKPNLPLASGEYSVKTGILIVLSFAVLSFFIWWIVRSWPLFWALFISFLLGTAYSINLPLLRWKRFAVVAAICILVVRAVIVQLAFFLHMQTFVFRRPAAFSRPLIFATAFMSFFSVVIALFKDIPDIDGDRIFGIRSFTVRLGQKRVFWTCVYLLEMAYSVAVAMGIVSSCTWSKFITISGHAILASILWSRAKSLDLKSKAAITSFYMFIWKVSNERLRFYMFIWKLFYAEYLLIPLVR